MSRVTTLGILKEWEQRVKPVHDQYELFKCITMSAPDSPLFAAVFAMADAYTKVIAEKVGDCGGWLDYFQYDCEFGAKPRIVTWEGRKVEVKSIEDLVEVIKG